MSRTQQFARTGNGRITCVGCDAGLVGGDRGVFMTHQEMCPEITAIRSPVVERSLRNSESALADLGLLLRTLGLGDHARPQSPHEVMLEAIEEVRRLKAAGRDGLMNGPQVAP
jgi:hypothetical protein